MHSCIRHAFLTRRGIGAAWATHPCLCACGCPNINRWGKEAETAPASLRVCAGGSQARAHAWHEAACWRAASSFEIGRRLSSNEPDRIWDRITLLF
jgi:hypothetical protein